MMSSNNSEQKPGLGRRIGRGVRYTFARVLGFEVYGQAVRQLGRAIPNRDSPLGAGVRQLQENMRASRRPSAWVRVADLDAYWHQRFVRGSWWMRTVGGLMFLLAAGGALSTALTAQSQTALIGGGFGGVMVALIGLAYVVKGQTALDRLFSFAAPGIESHTPRLDEPETTRELAIIIGTLVLIGALMAWGWFALRVMSGELAGPGAWAVHGIFFAAIAGGLVGIRRGRRR